jgi:hypothetical protein
MQKRFAEQAPQEKINKDSYIALEISQVVKKMLKENTTTIQRTLPLLLKTKKLSNW